MENFASLRLYAHGIILLVSSIVMNAQETFTRKDSLHGGLRFERTCFDVLRYDLNIKNQS